MRKPILLSLLAFVLSSLGAAAQDGNVAVMQGGGAAGTFATDSLAANMPSDGKDVIYSEVYLDTVTLKARTKINNYTMIGVSYGVTMTSASLNPKVSSQIRPYVPGYYSILLTHYEKMFDYLPYFGVQVGLAHGNEGYRFKPAGKEKTLYFYPNDLCSEVKIETWEIPFIAQIHFDSQFIKFMGSAGIYGGYRYSIERTMSPNVEHTIFRDYIPKFEEHKYSFYDTDRQWDYGIMGGAEIGFIFDPIEIHAGALVRYGWSSFFTPDSQYPADSEYADRNKIYYRYATPLDIIFNVSLHVHLTRRYGKTTKDLRKEAHDIVYGTE